MNDVHGERPINAHHAATLNVWTGWRSRARRLEVVFVDGKVTRSKEKTAAPTPPHRMTTKAVLLALSIAISTSVVTGCQSVPIHNVTNARLTPPPGTRPTLTDISEAIHTAGVRLGWRMEEARPGVMTGTLTPKPGRMAMLSITYDTSTFSIAHKDSKSLKHDGNNIHPRYNRWVRVLEAAIQEEVARRTPSN